MKIKNTILISIAILLINGCGVPQEEYEKLNSKYTKLVSDNQQLTKKLDECKNGENKIIARIEKANKEKKYSDAVENIKKLYSRFPESLKNKQYQKLLKELNKNILLEKNKREEKAKEERRLANLNNTGMWEINFFVDDFGEPTKRGYIINNSKIRGTFSNTATQNSELDVNFIITDSDDISIVLYEYAGNNPVKAYSSVEYEILMQDKDGKRFRLEGTNDYSERLSCNSADSKKIHQALLKGGNIKFKIIEKSVLTTNYSFTISNTEWYNNAYRKLKGN